MMRKIYEWFFGQDPIIEEVSEMDLELSPPCMTYIYGPGISEGEWITHWSERA